MSARPIRYFLAAVTALLVLPLLEAIFFFVISGGEQSLRGGFNQGHVDKYLGIWLWLASWTTAIVAAAGLVVLGIARLARRFSTPSIVGVSLPVAIVAGPTFLSLSGSNASFAIDVWVIAALCGAVASLTFCLVAGVPWRSGSKEAAP